MDLDGAVTIVTGSSSGLGAAAAQMLAQRGCRVVVNCSKTEAKAKEVAAACETHGVETLVCVADVSKDADCRRMAGAAMEKWGRIDGLINNAGTTKFCAMPDLDGLDAEDFQWIYGVNVIGPFQMVRAVAPHMKAAGRGSIVNIASTAGITGVGSSLAYAASKGALITLTKGLARALGPEIRVNSIAPGFIQGEWLREGLGDDVYEAVKGYFDNTNPLGRTGTPEDMAEATIALLAQAELVTGEVLTVDAGAHLPGGLPLPGR